MLIEISTWIGLIMGGLILSWGVWQTGAWKFFVNWHGILLVLGGTLCAAMINSPLRMLWRAFRTFLSLFFAHNIPPMEDVIGEIARLAERARAEGGLLNLQGEGENVMEGFLSRCLHIALTTGEANETRKIISEEIRQRRIRRQEDANLFRTMGVLAPMFGLMGTLLGIVQVLRTITDPNRVGMAMALAITTAFYGITLANLLFVPAAGKVRIRAIQESLVMEVIMEGVLDILESKPPYLIGLHLNSYTAKKRETSAAPPAQIMEQNQP